MPNFFRHQHFFRQSAASVRHWHSGIRVPSGTACHGLVRHCLAMVVNFFSTCFFQRNQLLSRTQIVITFLACIIYVAAESATWQYFPWRLRGCTGRSGAALTVPPTPHTHRDFTIFTSKKDKKNIVFFVKLFTNTQHGVKLLT